MIRTMNKAIVPYNMCPTLITNTVFTPGFGFYIINDDCNLNFPEATSIGNDKYNY